MNGLHRPDEQMSSGATPSPHSRPRVTRRAFARSLALVGAAPFVAGLLAACGGGGNESSTTPTSVTGTSSAAPTTTSATPSASPTAAGSPTSAGAQTGGSQAAAIPYKLEEPKHQGGQLVYGVTIDGDSANPIISKNSNRAGVFSVVWEGLVQTNPTNGAPMGLLAKSWEISSDGLTYSFTLQDEVTWQDGQPLTAQDAKFTYDLILNKATASPRNGFWSQATSIEAPDDQHITIKLAKPNATFLNEQGAQGIIPQHILKDVDPAAVAQHDFSTGKKGVTIGSGPFVFEEWIKDDHITFTKNPSYWADAPYLDRFIAKVVPSQTVLTQQLKTGEVDLGFVQPADYSGLKEEANINAVAFDSDRTVWYGYQLDRAKSKLFQDKEVRQALFYALNRPQMVEAIEFGLATVAVGMVPDLSWAHNPDGIKLKYEFDVEKAKELLDSAGWVPGSDGVREKDGMRLAFTLYAFSGNDALEEYVTVMQQEWKQIGVECSPKLEETNAVISRLTTSHDFEAFVFNNGMGIDPDQSAWWTCADYTDGFNFMKYCNPQVDKLLEEGLATTDQDRRKEIYTEEQNIMLDDLPVAFMTFQKRLMGVNKRVHNYFPNTIANLFGPQKWWVDA